MFRILFVFTLMFFCFSCVSKVDPSVETPSRKSFKSKLNCSASPPVLDKNKIAKMLKDSGMITADMNEEESNQLVSDFINRKNNAHKDCNK